MLTRRTFCVLLTGAAQQLSGRLHLGFTAFSVKGSESTGAARAGGAYREAAFPAPPDSARPYALWMWMGHNVSAAGITRDLEAMRDAGIGGATIYSLSDTVIPWAGAILKSPSPEIVAFTEPWWALLHHAATECDRLGLELILHNCAGYESSGGKWITPELSMQEAVWSERRVSGDSRFEGRLERAKVDPHPHAVFPDCYIPSEDKVGVPVVEARKTFYRDIAVLAVPATDIVPKERILNLSEHMNSDGDLKWDAPAGEWTLYRFGHTTTGTMIQPAQWDAMGLECDKMSREAVSFHVQHVLAEMKKHVGDQMGKALTTLYFDSYEAGEPTWTPKMREEFQSRRGYDLTQWLPVLAGRVVCSGTETQAFQNDFKRTVEDLYRDRYWATPGPLAHAAGVKFNAEPYEGPWQIGEVVQYLDTPTVEFWTNDNRYSPASLDPVVKAAHRLGKELIAAESFTTSPDFGKWTEHPAWLKPIGDAAFCAGVNRINIHHFVQQAWDDRYKPGNVMGQWGIHLGRYQTWWRPGRAWLQYLWRCQALLQHGHYVAPSEETSMKVASDELGPHIQSIHRRDGESDIYFVANIAWTAGKVDCTFPVQGRHPELWDPVANTVRDLHQFTPRDGATNLALEFDETQSFFVIFRRPLADPSAKGQVGIDFPALKTIAELDGPWQVSFDPNWGGPESIEFQKLMDWTNHENPGIKYYSGTASYKKTLEIPSNPAGARVYLDLGTLKHIGEVRLNGKDLGVVWTAPWRVEITEALTPGRNQLAIDVTNVWANRLIGDEQHPPDIVWQIGDPKFRSGYFLKEFPDWFLKGEPRPVKERLTFTTWNYFEKDSPLVSSGLMGPVRILIQS
jgi:hypothetical protein